jgi:archaellum biogenesis ATPase FlaH
LKLEEIAKDNQLIEKLIIQLMFKDSKFRDAVLPYIKPEMFQYRESEIILTRVHMFFNEFGEFPKVKSFALSLMEDSLSTYFSDCFKINVGEFNYEHLIATIEHFIRRSLLVNQTQEMIEEVAKPDCDLNQFENTPDVLRDALSFSFDTTVGVDLMSDEGIDAFFDFMTDVKNKVDIKSLPTVNKMIGGGFFSKSLSLLVGGTNTGKSAAMCALASDNILNDKKVLYVTLEMSEMMIGQRILANVSDTKIEDFPTLQKNQFKEKILNIKNIMNSIVIKEFPPSTINSNTLRKLLRDLKNKKGFVPDIIYVDYIGLMKPNVVRKTGSKYEDLKTVSEEVRAIAVEGDYPIVSVAQANRGGMGSSIISLTDIAESFGIAMTADLVISLNQPDELKPLGRFIWAIIKHRFGINLQSTQVAMNFKMMRLGETNEPVKIIDSVGETIDINGETIEPESVESELNLDGASNIIRDRLNKNNTDNIKESSGFVFT